MSKTKTPNIIYIMGTGRSGTTILELLLKSNPNISGVGEVTHVFQDGFIDHDVCSCGTLTQDCSFWQQVQAHAAWSEESYASYAKVLRSIDWHTGFIRAALGFIDPKKLKVYQQINQQIFLAASSIDEADFIVDSSKYAARALVLPQVFSAASIKMICLTRSPEGMIHAFRKSQTSVARSEQKPKSLLAIVLYYCITLSCFRWVMWRNSSAMIHITYEDLMIHPQKTLRNIGEVIGVDVSDVCQRIASNQALDIGHIVTGNRLRKQSEVKFSPSSSAPKLMNSSERLAAAVMNTFRKIMGF